MRTLAMQFRAYAAQTDQSVYQVKMLETADALELQAAEIDHYRRLIWAMPQTRRTG
jgi:hypothetical protein